MPSKEKDLGIKVGTPEEKVWTEILEREEATLTSNKVNQEIAEIVIDLSKKRIAEEKEKI